MPARSARASLASGVFAVVLAFALGCKSKGPANPFSLGPAPPDPVRRVATLAPSLTETVVALGAADRLVGVSRYDELPEVAKLPRIGGYLDPSAEGVAALAPDLVLVHPSPGNRNAVERIAELGVPVLVLPGDDIAGTLTAIREVGRALGLADRAVAVAAEIESTRASVRMRAKAARPVRALIAYSFQPMYVAGPDSFAHELLLDAGGVNAAEGTKGAYPVYPVEAAMRSPPEVIIESGMVTLGASHVRSLPGLRDAKWVRFPSKDLNHPGPFLGRALEQLFSALHEGADAGGAAPPGAK
ncbi:MAG: ABC transporter substrate-binding protein [Myxococcales bacterium]|nr:ABC transporter substrate-binding protein [Myxococcales bacterium]